MRLGILAPADSWHYRDLQRAADAGDSLVPLSFAELASELSDDRCGVWSGEWRAEPGELLLVRAMPAGSLEQVIFRMDALAAAELRGQRVINPPKAIEAAVDKYLALVRMQQAGLPIPPTTVCEQRATAWEAYERWGGDVVVKPLFGSEGRGLLRVSDPELAFRTFQTLDGLRAIFYLQPYLSAQTEWRILVIGDALFAMQRANAHDWRANLCQGGRGVAADLPAALGDLARRAAAAVGAIFAGVDILIDTDGRPHVLEVNAAPGWRGLARVLDHDIAAELLTWLRRLAG